MGVRPGTLAIVALIVAACGAAQQAPSLSTPSPTSQPPVAAPASPAASVPEGTGAATRFTSAMYPYALTLPDGWTVLPASIDEEFFASPDQALAVKVGSGQPDPGQTVEDRVKLLRANQFADCRTDQSQDREIIMGNERGILWSAICDRTYFLAANTIHKGTGYRLEISGGADIEDVLADAMDELLGSFTFTD